MPCPLLIKGMRLNKQVLQQLQSQMSSGVSYYEGELYNIIRQGRSVPAVPLVIIGIEE